MTRVPVWASDTESVQEVSDALPLRQTSVLATYPVRDTSEVFSWVGFVRRLTRVSRVLGLSAERPLLNTFTNAASQYNYFPQILFGQ